MGFANDVHLYRMSLAALNEARKHIQIALEACPDGLEKEGIEEAIDATNMAASMVAKRIKQKTGS